MKNKIKHTGRAQLSHFQHDACLHVTNTFFLSPRDQHEMPLLVPITSKVALGKSSSFHCFLALIGPAARADFRRLYPANAKIPTCCPSDDNRTKVTNSVTSARSLWWHVGPYFWPADLTRTANPIVINYHHTSCRRLCGVCSIYQNKCI